MLLDYPRFITSPISPGFLRSNVLNISQSVNLLIVVVSRLTADLVQTIPTWDNLAFAVSKTFITLASVVALPIQHTAKISSHLSRYRSVIFHRAEFRSRSPVGWSLLIRYLESSYSKRFSYLVNPQEQALCSGYGLSRKPCNSQE
jgi:hypothetical protein